MGKNSDSDDLVMGVAGLSGHAHASQALDGGAPIIWSRRRSATARWQAPAARLPPGGPTVAPHARRVASGSGELEATPPCGKKDPNTLRPSRSVHSGGNAFRKINGNERSLKQPFPDRRSTQKQPHSRLDLTSNIGKLHTISKGRHGPARSGVRLPARGSAPS